MNTSNPILLATLGVWTVLELWLLFRDRRAGKGGTAEDRGTRRLIAVVTAIAIIVSGIVARGLRHDSGLWLPGAATDVPIVVGLVIIWSGLILRVWSIATLGAAFRTTVEVDDEQRLVDHGPYRWLRHPSYTGVLLITTGYGVVTGVWPALAIAIVGPCLVLARRIQVEEAALTKAMGDVYRDYQRRTRRLIPGVW